MGQAGDMTVSSQHKDIIKSSNLGPQNWEVKRRRDLRGHFLIFWNRVCVERAPAEVATEKSLLISHPPVNEAPFHRELHRDWPGPFRSAGAACSWGSAGPKKEPGC